MNEIKSLCKPWKNSPIVIGFLSLVRPEIPSVEVETATGNRWFPARGLRVGFLNRFRCAWLVFTGQADAFVWPEHDPVVIDHRDEHSYDYVTADRIIHRYGVELFPRSSRKLTAAQLVEDHRRLSRRVRELREQLSGKVIDPTDKDPKFWNQQR